MAKSKDRASSSQQSSPIDNAAEGKPAAENSADGQLPLLDEVQAFLSQRAELLKKVTAEIAATERKLVELRQTAAMLSGNGKVAGIADRKPRNAKPKKGGNDTLTLDPLSPSEVQG
jgi:hypothetical protein